MLLMSLYDGNVHQELLVCGSAADAPAHLLTTVTPTVRQVCAAALQQGSAAFFPEGAAPAGGAEPSNSLGPAL